MSIRAVETRGAFSVSHEWLSVVLWDVEVSAATDQTSSAVASAVGFKSI